jgi:hypothetical protein
VSHKRLMHLSRLTAVLNSIALIKLLRTPAAPAVLVFPVSWAQPASAPL